MFQANLPVEFQGECVLSAVHLINRTPSGVLRKKTTFEIIYGHAPVFKVLRTFECLAFSHNQTGKKR